MLGQPFWPLTSLVTPPPPCDPTVWVENRKRWLKARHSASVLCPHASKIFFCIFFGRLVCWPLLCWCRSFCIFERCLDPNPESWSSKQARYKLNHPSPSKILVFVQWWRWALRRSDPAGCWARRRRYSAPGRGRGRSWRPWGTPPSPSSRRRPAAPTRPSRTSKQTVGVSFGLV